MIRGSTELVAIVGSPIAQVKSPENFNTWFNHNNCNLAMLPIDLHEAALDSFADTLRGWQNLRGCVVTVPYKQALANRVDGLSERAAALGSVNVIRRERDGRLLGDNVDGAGFLGAAHKHGFEPAGKRALVIGCGGVGSAIAYALAEAGIASITLSDPSTARMGAVCELLGNGFPGLTVSTQFNGLEDFDLVANASPVGMGTRAELPLSAALGWQYIQWPGSDLYLHLAGWGVQGVWCGAVTDVIVRAAIFVWRYFQGGWLRAKV